VASDVTILPPRSSGLAPVFMSGQGDLYWVSSPLVQLRFSSGSNASRHLREVRREDCLRWWQVSSVTAIMQNEHHHCSHRSRFSSSSWLGEGQTSGR